MRHYMKLSLSESENKNEVGLVQVERQTGKLALVPRRES